ncbi:MAG: NTP transferase domain-containing protein [Candidatus Eisenbacteria bacterium]|uniref:Glucose-1-phosphate adenylyltransferase n=1 Tax=Eiseniibacteriota bacterium TaxID=2212470 RepID=A0A9D6L706_UNCEI|nr:NTP transferase domain-containing protein [Candidatus Eisenbacteria bacterium]MBI3538999.1 NTP transferase domain-containing protein [Candidatus Eisenbacteria bacterium]
MLAGGLGSRLCLLSERRAKPAVPFGGKYRIIDFTLSNCVNSGIYDVGVLTQYRPTSLRQHIGIGRPWDLDRTRGGVQLLQPSLDSVESDWYQGTADAIYRNLLHLRRRASEHVVVLSGDHVYKMDYTHLFAFHAASHASVTVAVTEVPAESVSAFGIIEAERDGRVVGFQEKPRQSRSRLASMGVYLFDRRSLIEWLTEDAAIPESGHDFGKDLLPRLVARGEAVYALRFRDYWQDVGTVDSYYRTNMDLLSDRPPLDLSDPSWLVHTQSADRPPVRIERGGGIERSLVANGCRVAGKVVRSVLFPGVVVAPGATITDSIVMNDTLVLRGAALDRAIVDKEVVVGESARLGWGDATAPNRACPEHLASGLLVVGKGARVPGGVTVGRNARIGAMVPEREFTGDVPAGGVVQGPEPEH